MPYTGKPSKGCDMCKSRRIKCDETKPICNNCIKSGRRCPGYREEFDIMFRDENKAMAKKVRNSSRRRGQSSRSVTPSSPHGSPLPTSYTDPQLDQLEAPPFPDVPVNLGHSVWHSLLSNLEHALPATVRVAPEYEAVPFFFRNFVPLPQRADSMRGYLNLLLPLYNRTLPSSTLHLATKAVSLAAYGNYPGKQQLMSDAARAYGEALGKLNEDLRDPVAGRSDETILAILLFSLYENLSSTDDTLQAWGNHVDGAVALVKLRGAAQFQDPTSHEVFRAVRSMMVMNCMQRSKPVDFDPFPGGEGWVGSDVKEENPANRLTLICINLPNIRARASRLIQSPYNTTLESEALNILHSARTVEESLQNWYETLPEVWRPQLIGVESKAANAEIWPGEQHVYPDVSIASIVNDYRVCRIFCQHVIMHCATWLSVNPVHQLINSYNRAAFTIQQTANDIAACVPFHLSYDMQPVAKMLGQERIAAEGYGGYSLVWPLYVAAHAQTVPHEQKMWFLDRLHYIGKEFGLSNVQVLVMAKQHVLTCGPLFP
ncbi:hypothetical protein DM02DRAFT_642649 [Periconia macrospinosa]|uniref:Zn(2)-C6 fungal-type domain-containing protein n=1 Tax=Periconia macrospinosa TaxID=97972 RepID=A0A2V1DPD8_9PLEO|nr:hypothetical protein DM02DRAFT_642649 [Periconia macrospinosa]